MFDTIDENQPVATCLALESFRSSMTLDFLRQRFALTRIHPLSSGCFSLLVLRPSVCVCVCVSSFPASFLHPVSVFSFCSLDTCTWAWPELTTKKTTNASRVGESRREWRSFIGNTFLWVKNRVAAAREDFRYHARAALWLSANCYDKSQLDASWNNRSTRFFIQLNDAWSVERRTVCQRMNDRFIVAVTENGDRTNILDGSGKRLFRNFEVIYFWNWFS